MNFKEFALDQLRGESNWACWLLVFPPVSTIYFSVVLPLCHGLNKVLGRMSRT